MWYRDEGIVGLNMVGRAEWGVELKGLIGVKVVYG